MQRKVHRFIVAAAVGEWIAVATGAFQSSSRIAQSVPELRTEHAALGLGVILVVLGLCVRGGVARSALWATFGSLVLSGITGWIAPGSPGRVVWHSVFSHMAVGLVTVAAVMTSASWSQAAKPVSAGSWKALRPAALWTPPIVLLQIAMGALYRHQLLGVMPHMLGAMVVAILALVVSMTLMQHFGDQPQLKNSAAWLIGVVLVQVCLGIAAFLMLLLGAGNTSAFVWLTTGHVGVGSLTFAASVVVGMQARRYLAAD